MIQVKVEHPNCVPMRAYDSDAGLNLKSNEEDFMLKAGKKVKIGTGVTMSIGRGFFGMVVPRSGLGGKFEVVLANNVGVIDSGYLGEIMLFLKNNSAEDYKVKRFDRVAQLILIPCALDTCVVVPHLEGTERGDNGFGSSGA